MTQPEGEGPLAERLGRRFGAGVRSIVDHVRTDKFVELPLPLIGLKPSHATKFVIGSTAIAAPKAEEFLSGTDEGARVPPGTSKAVLATAAAVAGARVIGPARVAKAARAVAGPGAVAIIKTATKDDGKTNSATVPKTMAAPTEGPSARTNHVERDPRFLRTVEQTLSDPYNN